MRAQEGGETSQCRHYYDGGIMAFEFPGWPRQSTPAGHCACPPLRPLVVLIEVAVILMPGDSVRDAGANYQTG